MSEQHSETLAHQRASLTAIAKERGWRVERYVEGVSSGMLGVRTHIRGMLGELRALTPERRPRWIPVTRVDRVGRGANIVETQLPIYELKQLGVGAWTRENIEVRLETAMEQLFPPSCTPISAFAMLGYLDQEPHFERSIADWSRKRVSGENVYNVDGGRQVAACGGSEGCPMTAADRRAPDRFSPRALLAVFDDAQAALRTKIVAIYVLLVGATAVVWALALLAFSTRPLLLGTALLAYTFGLRHAVDADHISAIDNVTRKLMQEGKRPVAVGFFFSLGHSTIVVGLSIAIAVAATLIKHSLPRLETIGGVIGTSVSATFLYVIAILNILVFIEIAATFRRVRRGEPYCEQTLEAFLADRGLMGRFFKPLLRVVGRSWQMYPIGVLFGLGFDTATEVGLLGIAAVEGTRGLPIYDILLFPLLFTAGMSLLDTTDGILMLGAYGWAYVKPIRKMFYNMTITLVSVIVALLVGTIEALSIIGGQLSLHGAFWARLGDLSGNFGFLGFAIIGVFIAAWLLSTLVYRMRGYDNIEVTAATESWVVKTTTV